MNQWSNHVPRQNPYQPPNQNYPHAPPQHYGAPYRGYEFSPAEEKVFKSATTWTLALGVLMICNAGVDIFMSGRPTGYVTIIVSISLIVASSAFRKVTTTKGNDVQHLMSALNSLGHVFIARLIGLLIIVAILAFIAVAMVAVIAFIQTQR
jgi:hypothetical protein